LRQENACKDGPKEMRDNEVIFMRLIVVSDLHADYWDDAKLDMFLGFLNSDLMQGVERFILNGDIFDLPSSSTDLSWPQRRDKLMTALARLAVRIPFIYLTGNHDLATQPLGPMTILGGNLQLEPEQYRFDDGGTSFLLKHGHQYDPLFVSDFYNVLNLIDHFTGINLGIEVEQIIKDLEQKLGRSSPSTADRVQFYKDVAAKTQATDRGPVIGIPPILDVLWQLAAAHLAKDENVNNVIFGHTHNPEKISICDNQASYINSGDWVCHTTYLMIEDGTVTVNEWK
jgi:UDP-2,3-diacylglucosamine pyrophosphatase LpxH